MYSNSTFSTPSISNSCLYVLNNRLPGLARYLQAVFIVSNFLEDLINLNLNLKLELNEKHDHLILQACWIPEHAAQVQVLSRVTTVCS